MSAPRTLSRGELDARCARLETIARDATELAGRALAELTARNTENAVLYGVLSRQVEDATELRRQLANASVLTAFDALRAAPGWDRDGLPPSNAWRTHALTHPFQTGGALAEGGTPYGLWACDLDGTIGLIAVAFRGGCLVAHTVHGIGVAMIELDSHDDADGWLRLTADGTPVLR